MKAIRKMWLIFIFEVTFTLQNSHLKKAVTLQPLFSKWVNFSRNYSWNCFWSRIFCPQLKNNHIHLLHPWVLCFIINSLLAMFSFLMSYRNFFKLDCWLNKISKIANKKYDLSQKKNNCRRIIKKKRLLNPLQKLKKVKQKYYTLFIW